MTVSRLICSVSTMGLLALSITAAPYVELNKKFNRIKSGVMVRTINVPTMANLDYAAYNANPVRFDPIPNSPKPPTPAPTLSTITFGTALLQTYDALSKTPLTAAEKEQPMAWIALQNRLWEVVKTDAFGALASKINGEKWGDPSIFQPFQEVVAVYQHKAGDSTEFYVRIDVTPWVTFIKGLKDDNNDGIKNFYGKLALGTIHTDSLKKAITWINNDYCAKTLTRSEMVDWITALASYWYPSLNTDILDMTGQTQWPTAETEPEIAAEIKGLVVKDFIAVVRGRPMEKPIYNIYVVPPQTAEKPKSATVQNSEQAGRGIIGRDTIASKNFNDNNTRFEKEIKDHGSYADWAKSLAPMNDSLAAMLKILPAAQMGFKGKGDWLFFRKSIDYLLGGDLSNQPPAKDPIANLVAFKKLCDANNINLLFVPIPNKEEIYYDQLPFVMPKGMGSYTNPYSRKLLKDLQSAGVEVIDVLPLLTSAKSGVADKTAEDIYQHQDTHWTNRGLQIVAKAIAERIKLYGWYTEAAKNKKTYTLFDTTFSRKGDIVERLAEKDQVAYPAITLAGQQVKNADGSLYKSESNSPILLMGDSFTGVFESVDCKSAGVGAHIAAQSGLPVEIITSWGGGPGVRQKVLRAHKKNLNEKRLIIYMMVARDLYNYSQGWEAIDK